MINYVIDYMEASGIIFSSHNELENVIEGIKLYLFENGIPENDTREYFRQYLNRSLARIEPHETKQYFLAYHAISRVNQICIEYRCNGKVSDKRKANLLNDMSELYSLGLGYKYVPATEVYEILGRLA
mgnify:CR=1 FL=1